MQVFHGEKMLHVNALNEQFLKTEAVCRRIKKISSFENHKKKGTLSAVYEYKVGEQNYYKSIYFKTQKQTDGKYIILYPERIIVFYDERYPRISYWERNVQYRDLEYKSLK